MTTQFRSYRRPGVHRTATPPPQGSPRLTGHLKLHVADDIGQIANPDIAFALAGPADVVGVEPKAVVKRYPAPGVADAEVTKAPYLELTPADLPWRYTAAVPSAGGLRPWLVLVVGPAATMALDGHGRVTLPAAVTGSHPLPFSAGWAHVHRPGSGDIARLLSPQSLDQGVLHLAVLVPAYRLDAGQLVDAWIPGAKSVPLAVFDSWSFTTVTNPDDFTSIARRLEPLSGPEWARLRGLKFGSASVHYRLPQPEPHVELPAGAALTLVPHPGVPAVDATEADPTVLTDLGALANAAREHDGRWVLGMPHYAEPWPFPPGIAPPPGTKGWVEELTDDPRRRGVAGLGAWIAIEWQDRIADAAADQAGAVAAAAERVRHLVLGLSAARSLWARRVPDDPLAQLWLLGPTLAKLPTDTGGSVLAALSARVPSLAAVRSGAARRALRRGSTAARLARPGAVDPVALLVAANRCPPGPPQAAEDVAPSVDDWLANARPPEGQVPLADPLDSPRLRGFFDYEVARPELGPEAVDDLRRRLGIEGPPPDHCRPVHNLAALGRLVAAACNPMGPEPAALVRVRATVHGLPEPWLKPPDLTPELDLPLSVFLTERAPDWLMPGVGDLPIDRAVGTASNPVFIESLLVGANHRATGELRWRNLPVVTGWTPLRRFWNRIGKAGTPSEGPLTDIDGIVDIAKLRAKAPDWLRWPAGSRLGDPSHLPDPTRGANFVVLLHTSLFHRYPATVCRLVVARKAPDGTPDWTVDPDPAEAQDPTFKGHIGPDVTFFGFPVVPQAGRDHWVVIEESPPGYRFWSPTANGTPAWGIDGGVVALNGLVRPARVLLGRLVEDNG